MPQFQIRWARGRSAESIHSWKMRVGDALRLDTSLRERDPEWTWEHLRAQWPYLGVTRVTDTTRLDKVGMPVYAAVRPGATQGSLCVSSGKALTPSEARLGAICEAAELASAEPRQSRDTIGALSIQTIEHRAGFPISQFALRGHQLDRVGRATELHTVEALDLYTGRQVPVPAAHVFLPYRGDPVGNQLFSQSSNGLAAGSTREEALLHATLELIERDTLSFARIARLECRVTAITDPRWQSLAAQVKESGLRLYVTTCPNPFKLPMFIAYIFDDEYWGGICLARGQGLHVDKSISLMRATTEAVQSRLTNIHGGRDDIVRRFTMPDASRNDEECNGVARFELRLRELPEVDYQSVCTNPVSGSVDDNLSLVLDRLQSAEFRHVLAYSLCHSDEPPGLNVVKVIVPGLEFFMMPNPCIGPRLLRYIERLHG